MVSWHRAALLRTSSLVYQGIRPLVFTRSAGDAHHAILRMLSQLDSSDTIQTVLKQINRIVFPQMPVTVGSVTLPYPMILAAGFVKGHGFTSDVDGLSACMDGKNIIPGWRTMPTLLGPVEFGSFTRYPRIGNPGAVMWRDTATKSTQNRVGLKNPGALIAAKFLAKRLDQMPPTFGINVAPSPGLHQVEEQIDDVIEAVEAFITHSVVPSWFTLNLSCPNTEDDPLGHQTETEARAISAAVVRYLQQSSPTNVPLWVKVSPCLSQKQYAGLMAAFADTGVRAVIATNTLGRSAPTDPTKLAGVGGGSLHQYAVAAATALSHAKTSNQYPVDVVGCGGVRDYASFHSFWQHGVRAVQYWSSLVYQGPLVPAKILHEIEAANDRNEAGTRTSGN